MKTLFHIGEKIFGVLLWIPEALTLLAGLVVAIPHAKRYLHVRAMSD